MNTGQQQVQVQVRARAPAGTPVKNTKCCGWLSIILSKAESNIALVSIQHHEDHVHYCTIDVPNNVKEMVKAGCDKTVSQVGLIS
jgi:hypothetical protein